MDLNSGFTHACSFIFGQEIGDMKDYENYLKEAMVGKLARSSLSGDRLFLLSDQYCGKARFFDYAKEHEKVSDILSKPLDINKIKDTDSLFSAVKEKYLYAGGKVLGQSEEIVASDDITNSQHISYSSMIVNSKYLAYCYQMRNTEYAFASTSSGDSSWILRCFYNNSLQRCFECSASIKLRDCYFCYNLRNCNDCMFTFNTQAKSYMIGNIQLEKQKYLGLKKKLLGEIVSQLKQNKRLNFSIINIPQLGEVGNQNPALGVRQPISAESSKVDSVIK
ncbi:hypothetical protein KKF81_03640 [Candidatus Micrarchaeota archaeon]|nr:hypothetical protein [Candidatus Micrarchaeota archaeon]